jgi:hypothetical protein
VLSVKLGSQSPGSESVVELLLSQPGREFSVSVEAEARTHMTNDVMDGAKPVVRAAELAPQKRVTALALPGACSDFEDPVSAHCTDQFIVRVVGGFTSGELNSETGSE